jgi:hypothetical protein
MAGPYPIKKVYPRACLVDLPPDMKIFPVFHNSLLRPNKRATGLPGQRQINEAESRHLRGRVLEREDGADEVVEKWEFEALLDCHNDYGDLQYLVKWKYHAPTWQPATDLKGQDEVILEFHRTHPGKPGPPPWVKSAPTARRSARLRGAPMFLRQFSPASGPFETNGCVGGGYCHGTSPGLVGGHMTGHVTPY